MNNRDVTQRISGDILQHQLQLAKNATPGEWYDAGNGIIAAKRGARTPNPVAQVDNEKDAAHIIANSPDVVITIINEILRLREENRLLKHWANAEGAARQCHMKVAYYLMKAIDNGGFEIVAQIPMFKEANSLQDAADAARKAVEEACPKK